MNRVVHLVGLRVHRVVHLVGQVVGNRVGGNVVQPDYEYKKMQRIGKVFVCAGSV